jgi:hypothetical protein
MGFTLEQFKEWIAETFPDNKARAIAENNFREGLAKMADFVFETNSSEFILDSINQAAGYAESANNDRSIVSDNLILTQQQRILAEEALAETISSSEAYLLVFQDLIAQGFKVKGNWDIATNTPNLTSIPKLNGDAYIVLADATSNITGTNIAMKKGDAVHWNATDSIWIHRPNAAVPADGTVSPSKLIPWMANIFTQLPDDSPYKLAILDAFNRMAFAIRKDGFIEGRFIINAISMMANAVHTASIQNQAVTLPKLGDDVKASLNVSFDASGNYLYLLLDAMNRIGLGAEKDGSIFIPKIKLSNGAIKEEFLSAGLISKLPSSAFYRLNAANTNDVSTTDDGMFRSQEIDIPAKTDSVGTLFVAFPPVRTKVLKGINNTGTSLTFRKTSNYPVRGRRHRGTYNPTASGSAGINYRGVYGNSYSNIYPAFPIGNTGDCWTIDCGNTTSTKTANGLTFKNGDSLVKTASGYEIQPGPGDGTLNNLDFWNVTNTGYFSGIYLTAGSRIYIIGRQGQGGPNYVMYLQSRPGELFYMGEADPTTFAPVSPVNGDIYNLSQAGTTQGITGSIGDALIYDGGWGLLKGDSVIVPSGNSFFLNCSEKSNEWAVRRTDKSATVVIVTAKGIAATIQNRPSDDLLLVSDSMFGSGGVGSKIIALSGRAGTVLSYGGAGSIDVLAMVKWHIRNGDPYAGRIPIFWHGQNNQTDLAVIKAVSYEMAELAGANQKRFIFWSVLGQRLATFNGTRIVVALQEEAKAGTNNIAEIESFYKLSFPKQWFSPRVALLETAVGRTTPDPQFPGMTEEQVAATYGIVPFSYFFDYSGKSFTAANLVFLGYHSAAGLPSGGADKEYYIRSGNGTVGQLIVNVSGVWTEYIHDFTHLTTVGADAVAAKFNTFLTLIDI